MHVCAFNYLVKILLTANPSHARHDRAWCSRAALSKLSPVRNCVSRVRHDASIMLDNATATDNVTLNCKTMCLVHARRYLSHCSAHLCLGDRRMRLELKTSHGQGRWQDSTAYQQCTDRRVQTASAVCLHPGDRTTRVARVLLLRSG